MTESLKLPTSFWVIAVLALIWNLLGLGAFVSTVIMMTPEALANMSPAEQELYANTPSWVNIAFAIAVICGTLGSIGLLLKEDWAVPVFAISLIGVITQFFYVFVLSNSFEVFGAEAAAMPGMIFIAAVFLVFYAHSCTNKGWLN